MKKLIIIPVVFLVIVSGIYSCSSDTLSVKEISEDTVAVADETKALLDFFGKAGYVINHEAAPFLLNTDDVYTNLGKWHIIDTRKNSDYIAGHIDGAVNVNFSDLLSYVKNDISPSVYEKIVLVCYSGQQASFAVSVLRHLGYGNVFSMKWGMSSWNKATADKWLNNTSSKYSGQLETKGNQKAQPGAYPILKTGKQSVYEILQARAQEIMQKPDFLVKPDKLFEDTKKYYIVNYWPMDSYIKGHIEGAVQYGPKKSLDASAELSTLPAEKPILVYCYTGQHAAFVAAYLQLLGYDAYALAYSANGFMQSKLKSEGIGHAFDPAKDIKNYPLIEGDKPSLSVSPAQEKKQNESEKDMPVAPVKKSKEIKEEGGGC